MPIDPPVIVVEENGDLLLFRDIDSAERYLEPIDIRNEEYDQAFDASGRRLDLEIGQRTVQKRPKLLGGDWKIEAVKVELSEREPEPEALKEHLRFGVSKLGVDVRETMELAELVQLAVETWGFS